MSNQFKTTTFNFGETEKVDSVFSSSVSVEYCAYCGEKAEAKDIGSTHNHQWEEDIIHYCNCEKAEKEKEIKTTLAEVNNQKYHLEKLLKDLQTSEENSLSIRKKKADKEIEAIKKKYKLNEHEV